MRMKVLSCPAKPSLVGVGGFLAATAGSGTVLFGPACWQRQPGPWYPQGNCFSFHQYQGEQQ